MKLFNGLMTTMKLHKVLTKGLLLRKFRLYTIVNQ
uniref:Uncharacterized protein n=1 Tax=Anguilla anguilla TaxID=7936 RepID=A0A0E9VNN9_ANGAN